MRTMRIWVAILLALVGAPRLARAQVRDTGRVGITIRVVTPPPPPADTPLVHQRPPRDPLLLELTHKARRISLETLFVYSAMDPNAWPYVGQAVDTVFESLFQPFYPRLAFPHDEPELFATRRFVLDPQHIGYLLRVPGMYESSALDLWVYDARLMRFALPIRLAEAWGDEGCGYNLESLLIRSKTDRRLTLILHQNTGCSDMETGRILSNVDSIWIRPWVGGVFAPPRISTDSTALKAFIRQAEAPR